MTTSVSVSYAAEYKLEKKRKKKDRGARRLVSVGRSRRVLASEGLGSEPELKLLTTKIFRSFLEPRLRLALGRSACVGGRVGLGHAVQVQPC